MPDLSWAYEWLVEERHGELIEVLDECTNEVEPTLQQATPSGKTDANF